MSCSHFHLLISLSIDGRLSPEEKEGLSSHLQSCPYCREALEETQKMHELFPSAERFSAPLGFSTRVMAKLKAQESSPWWFFLTQRPLFLKTLEWAFALIIIMTGLFFGNLWTADRLSPQRPLTLKESFSLDVFQATPPDSIGGAYMALAEGPHEK
ncbi:MAG TPA: zf-HC2 domain-containing protein [Thermodesulfobacteriota bacterium]|nr:zf-HC2 domain-containing protein [Thermodesulfobacteriota bacterium]